MDSAFFAEGNWKGDILAADVMKYKKMKLQTYLFFLERLNAKEVLVSKE